MNHPIGIMTMPGVGFFGLLFIGIVAGWLAERAMNRHHGLLTNLFVGIAGSFVGGTLASVLNIDFYGFVGNLVRAAMQGFRQFAANFLTHLQASLVGWLRRFRRAAPAKHTSNHTAQPRKAISALPNTIAGAAMKAGDLNGDGPTAPSRK